MMLVNTYLYFLATLFGIVWIVYWLQSGSTGLIGIMTIITAAIGVVMTSILKSGLEKTLPLIIVWGISCIALIKMLLAKDLNSIGWGALSIFFFVIGLSILLFHALSGSKKAKTKSN